ncbi:MAG TPA: hypothetical protein VGR28_08035 [Candidatus Thermoplasmatota archaeon]|nr:hypothetical protein [Candidatus Thermoplasmatota archaeon]
MRTAIVVILATSLALPLAAAHHRPSQSIYVIGTEGSDLPISTCGPLQALVVGDTNLAVAGGCVLTMPRAPEATIVVVDLQGEAVDFVAVPLDDGGSLCEDQYYFYGHGEGSFVWPDGCTHVTVRAFLGSLPGTVVVT